MIEHLPAATQVTLGAGTVLLLVVGAMLRGILIPAPMYQRLSSDLDKKDILIRERDTEISRLQGIVEKLSDSIERLSRRRVKE